MSPEIFFDQVVDHYIQSKDVVSPYKHDKIFRGRQHSISSVLEDLFAHFLQKHLSSKFPELDLYFMIDYGINVNGEKMIPDIAIIIRNQNTVLASYLDIKTDLGYKRNYFSIFPDIQKKVQKLRKSYFTGLVGDKQEFINISPSLKWRTIIMSDRNISAALLQANKDNSEKVNDFFSLYFLSGASHPNSKQKHLIEIYKNAFSNLLNDLEEDIRLSLIPPTLESLL